MHIEHLIDYLFIPVSSLKGVGEYTRSLIIAQELRERRPDTKIAFILNRHSPVVAGCPFSVFLVNDTPTKCSEAVNIILREQLPRVVIFDASGRVSQLKTAKKINAHTVFISQNAKKRKRGMRIRRARYTDTHYVVQPAFALPPLSFYETLKFRLIGCPVPECVGPIFKLPSSKFIADTLLELELVCDKFVLLNAGSGGHKIAGQLASDIFLMAGEKIAETTGLHCLVVMGTNYPNVLPISNKCQIVSHLSTAQFAAALSAAKFTVLSGGSGFLQANVLSKPTVVTAISSDQPEHIAAYKKLGFCFEAEVNPEAILEAAKLAANLSTFSCAHSEIVGGLDKVVTGLMKASLKS